MIDLINSNLTLKGIQCAILLPAVQALLEVI